MSKGELIDSHVSLEQCRKAVTALHTYETKKQEKLQENELLPDKEQNIWLNVTLKKIPSVRKFKPFKIPIVHPIIDPRTTSVCLITKDPQREYKALLEQHEIKFVSRVVGVEKLKGKFKPFEARRMLLRENGLFLADERIIPLLPKLLGSKWFKAKKQPIPVSLTRKDLKSELERAISSTYMSQNAGTNVSVKIGVLSQKPSQILANIESALPSVAGHAYGGWDNIQSFYIKTNTSASLPIWTCSLDDAQGGRWNGFTSEANEASGSAEESGGQKEEKKGKSGQNKGKRGEPEADEDKIPEKPKKKAKTSNVLLTTDTEVTSKSTKAKIAATIAADTSTPKKQKLPDSSPPTIAKSPNTTLSNTPKVKGKALSQKSETEYVPSVSKGKASKSKTSVNSNLKADIPPPKMEAGKPKKNVKPAAPAPTLKNSSSALTKEELKQKRSFTTGEKKKLKVMTSKGGKNIKGDILGKKAAQG